MTEYVTVWLYKKWRDVTLDELESLLATKYSCLTVKDSFGSELRIQRLRYPPGSYAYKYVKSPSRFWNTTTDLRSLLKNLSLTEVGE